jgi:glycerol-3-phosphate dehydrogenase (NAD(P)+)
MLKVAFLGGGSFGTALAVMLGNKEIDTAIWTIDEIGVEDINIKRENTKYLPGVTIPNNVTASRDLNEVVKNSNVVVLSVPSQVIRTVSRQVAPLLTKDQIVVTVAKGIEKGTLKTMSEIISEEVSGLPIVILSGPSHAEEVSRGIPTTVTVSSKDMEAAKNVQDIFSSTTFRVYTNDDLIGVQIGGACKNIIALAAGITDGVGYGDNAKAALMTRGMHEIVRIGTKLGGRQETFYGLTGMGDLIVTCTSMHSRNRRAGILIGQGKTMEEACKEVGMVVEGIEATKAFYELKEREEVIMPITDALYKVLFQSKDTKEAVYELMSREKKDEHSFIEV